ncbi:MAG TPA: hypothetical protein DEV81_00245 [Cyanobacteria bacterium UBA11049]|nr:hypothetical protein [Cyanobacteria bacterium UBA11049]
MLPDKIERELTDGQPWCFWQKPGLPAHLQQCVEYEQETVDIYEEALRDCVEQSRTIPSYRSGMTGGTDTLYQLISHYLWLLGVRKN